MCVCVCVCVCARAISHPQLGCKLFNADLSKWDVSIVTDMDTTSMFVCVCVRTMCDILRDLSKWDVSSVTDMPCMLSTLDTSHLESSHDYMNVIIR